MTHRFLFFIVLVLSAQGLPTSSPGAVTLTSPDSTYLKYLPPSFAARAQEILKNIPLTEPAEKKSSSSVEFVSGQSYTSSGLNIVNRIHYFPGAQIDVWLMRQQAVGRHWLSKKWTTLTLLVDKTTTPKTSYFLQWEKDPEHPTRLRPGAFTAMCFTCHPNGPRAIRPRYAPPFAPKSARLDGASWNRIYDWNGIITDYGEIKTYKPRVDILFNELPMDLPGRIDNEKLNLKACVGCHDHGSGVRAPLMRQHGDSILAMVQNVSDPTGFYVPALHEKYAFMPLVGHKLGAKELDCLKDWIANRNLRPPKAGCSPRGEVLQ